MLLYSKPNCHLCEVMKSELNQIRQNYDFELEVINIENDEELFRKYKDRIPVLKINGVIIAKFRIDKELIKKKLEE